MTVRLRSGVEIELSDGTRVVCDASTPAGDVVVVSHAHGDHTPSGGRAAVCSQLTADLVNARRDVQVDRTEDDRVALLPAGHVAGSRAALVTDPDGTRYLYTGDVCTRSRFYLDGFDPPEADVLVVESTYGTPEYVLPDHETVAEEIVSWLAETPEPVLLFGYSLGRAQKLQLFAELAMRERVFTTAAIRRVNEVVAAHLDVSFAVRPYARDVELGPGDALVLPSNLARSDWVERLVAETGALKAGFSGWALDDSFRFRGGYDATFPLSDHCDFAELCDLVEAVDPDRVYTHHGSTDALAAHLTRIGYEATALRRNQAALDEF